MSADQIVTVISNVVTAVIGYGALRAELVIIRKLLEIHKVKHKQHEERLDVLEAKHAA